MIPVGGLQMAKRSYSCSGSSNGNKNADHLRRRATHANASASSSDGEDDHDSMPPRKLLKSNGLQLRNAENFISWAALIVQLTILCYVCSEEVNLEGFMFTSRITISSFLAIYSSAYCVWNVSSSCFVARNHLRSTVLSTHLWMMRVHAGASGSVSAP